jgi:hypothetical protein
MMFWNYGNTIIINIGKKLSWITIYSEHDHWNYNTKYEFEKLFT